MSEPELHALRGAQAKAYAMLGQLLAAGLSADAVDAVDALPELAEGLAPYRDQSGRIDLDEVAAAHHRLFHFEVFPLISAFLDSTGRAGGDVTRRVQDDLRAMGVDPDRLPAPPDHLGSVMLALARVVGAEADAIEDDKPPIAARMRELTTQTLDRHVLPMLGAWAHAARQDADPFFGAVIGLTVELIVHHRSSLEANGEPADLPTLEPIVHPRLSLEAKGELEGLPTLEPSDADLVLLPELLDDPKTGLKDVVGLLLVPARSGLFLSRGALARAGRGEGVPRGFGTRRQELESLLFGAIDRERFTAVIGRLALIAQDAAHWHDGWSRAHEGPVGRMSEAWGQRAAATEQGLRRMATSAPPAA